MSLARTAARGALWTAAGSLAGRACGLVSTLVLTRFLAPEVLGEVSAASVLCFTASWVSHWGFGQYIVIRGADSKEHTFHAVFLSLVLGTIAIGLMPLVGARLAPLLDTPGLTAYLPGMALAVWLRRISGTAERLLVRDLKFRELSVAGAVAEVVYAVFAVYFVVEHDMGGRGIVWANVIQSVVLLGLVTRHSGLGWLSPTPLRAERFAEIIRFGLPIGAESLFHQAARTWDNLLFAAAFGPAALGHYNLAYNLADLPAVHVGEQVATALQPTFVRLEPDRRGPGLVRATALLALVVFPLGFGLSAVADPLIQLMLPPDWQGVAPLLTVLCVVSLLRPIGWVISVFIQVGGRTWALMGLEAVKVTVLLLGMALLAWFVGPVAAAASVGLAYGVHTLGLAWLAERLGAPSAAGLLGVLVRPFLAGALMWGVVVGLDRMLPPSPLVRLLVEIPVGAVVYIVAAWVFARPVCRDLLSLVAARRKGEKA